MSWKSHRSSGEDPLSEEEEEEGEEERDETVTGTDHIMFLIDAREEMKVNLRSCLEVALTVFKAKMISSSRSNIGILFFGTVPDQ